MTQKLTIIYEARTVPEAQRLKECLEEAGIPAVVGTEVMDGEASSDVWGLPIPARVAVDETDAEPARSLALDFENEIIERVEREAERSKSQSSEDNAAEARPTTLAGPLHWPQCPECGAPRRTRCPLCDTSGAEFHRAEFPEAEPWEAAEIQMVICPECDETFEPEYARQCHICGHTFADGFDDTQPRSRFAQRVLLALLALVAILGGSLLYFAFVLKRG